MFLAFSLAVKAQETAKPSVPLQVSVGGVTDHRSTQALAGAAAAWNLVDRHRFWRRRSAAPGL